MITEKDRIKGSAIVALSISQFLFTSLVKRGVVSPALAHSIITEAGGMAARNYSGDAQKYAHHVLIEMREWLEQQQIEG